MKIRLWLKYLGYIIIIYMYLNYRDFIGKGLQQDYKHFEITIFTFLIPLLFNIGLGILLGLESFAKEIRKEGNWKICWPKVIFMVLPLLYLSITILFQFTDSQILKNIFLYPINTFFRTSINFIPVSQLMLGYFFITSIYKEEEKRINLSNFINRI